METYIGLILACATFVGSHFLMSHPLRGPMVNALGEKGFSAVYSVIVLAAFGWMIYAFRSAPTGSNFWDLTNGVWIAASIVTLLATVLFLGSFKANPAMAVPGAGDAAQKMPSGAFLVTRHPMMWGFALWGVGHILVAPRLDSFIFVGSIILLALVGAKAQDGKKSKLMGEAWNGWVSRTSYWPRLSKLPSVGLRLWLIAVLVWLAASWLHSYFGTPPAGVYRWL